MSTDRPDTLFTWNGDAALAYQVLEMGTPDLLYRQGWTSNVELNWDHPRMTQFLRGLGAGRRLIVSDPRGSGCSERGSPTDVPTLELEMEDTLTVLDSVGSSRAVIVASNEQAFVACLFAATYPERTIALVLYEVSANFTWTPETPWEWSDEQWTQQEAVLRSWSTRSNEAWRESVRDESPTMSEDDAYVEWARRYQLLSGGLGAGIAQVRRYRWTDLRSVLPSIRVPVLILARPNHPEPSWYPAAKFALTLIPGAHLEELPGRDGPLWLDDGSVHRAITTFLRAVDREEAELSRVLATVLFTDITDSTAVASRLGDHGWADLLRSHHATVRALIDRYRGVEMDTAGDGFFATFDGPGRAVRCAAAIVDAVRPLGIEVRAGVHTGEVETVDGKAGGLAVNIGARVGRVAGPSEVVVTSTVKDLCAGSDLRFKDVGEHDLKGIPDRWRLYQVQGTRAEG
jgi:class 3 adenylate cyclase